jgi:hypothetical protein
MCDPFGNYLLYLEPAPVEDREHPAVLRQDLRVELRNSLLSRDPREMPERKACDAKPPIVSPHREGHLCPVRRISTAEGDVASCPDDLVFCAVLNARHERDSPDKIDHGRFRQLPIR